MLCVYIDNKNPFFCLAAEYHFMRHLEEDIILLWQSDNTVVVGKHQIAQAEVNVPYVHQNNITVARRISGGGTVFHDKGNVNFTIIKTVESTAQTRFKDFSKMMIQPIRELGVPIEDNRHNDLIINGKKVSGSSEHIYKKRVMHHGTLLFNADLQQLGNSLSSNSNKYKSRAVASNRSTVTNIANYLDKKITTQDFINFLYHHFLQIENSKAYQLNKNDVEIIKKLKQEKFATWEWNWGYAPNYQFTNQIQQNRRNLSIGFTVEKGIIQSANIKGNFWNNEKIDNFNKQIIGKKHAYAAIFSLVNDTKVAEAFF